MLAFVAVLIIEIILTMWDFVIEVVVRKRLGDVYAGERVTHNFMGIIYGSMIAFLIPELFQWWQQPTGFAAATHGAPAQLVVALLIMGAGVFISGMRDLYASFQLPDRRGASNDAAGAAFGRLGVGAVDSLPEEASGFERMAFVEGLAEVAGGGFPGGGGGSGSSVRSWQLNLAKRGLLFGFFANPP